MGYQIVRMTDEFLTKEQLYDGQVYAIYSSITGMIEGWGLDKKNLVRFFISEERKKIKRNVSAIILGLETHGNPYFQFTKTWAEIYDEDVIRGGKFSRGVNDEL